MGSATWSVMCCSSGEGSTVRVSPRKVTESGDEVFSANSVTRVKARLCMASSFFERGLTLMVATLSGVRYATCAMGP